MAAKKNKKATRQRQRFPKPEEMADELERMKLEYPEQFEFGRNVFELFVDPEAYRVDEPSDLDICRANAAFSEWFLFDFDIFDGLTLFEMMAEHDPSLDECAQTQFYSRFWVVDQDAKRGRVVLRDTCTQLDYTVRSPHIAHCERWANGVLGTRIGRAHGRWREVGQLTLHDNVPSEPLPQRKGKKRRHMHDPAAFLVNVEQTIGHYGAFRESVGLHDRED